MTDAEWLELVEKATDTPGRNGTLLYNYEADQIRREAWRRFQDTRNSNLSLYELASALDRIIQNLTGIRQE